MECIACEFVVGNIVLINFQLTWIVKLQGKQKLKKAFRVSFVTFLLAFSCSFLSVVTVTFFNNISFSDETFNQPHVVSFKHQPTQK